jgi:hypothetical protein
MARGVSGRIVLEIDPDEKQILYDAVRKDGLTLKEWFLLQKDEYLRQRGQLSLFPMAAETPESTLSVTKKSSVSYRKRKK